MRTPAGPFAAIQTAFQEAGAQQLAYLHVAGRRRPDDWRRRSDLVSELPRLRGAFCELAARSFFSQF